MEAKALLDGPAAQDGNESVISMSLESSAGDMAKTKSSSSSTNCKPKMVLSKEFREEVEDALRNPDVRFILGLHQASTCAHCGMARQKAAAAAAKQSRTSASATSKHKTAKLKRIPKSAIKSSKDAHASTSAVKLGTGGIPYCSVFSAGDYLRLFARQHGKCKCCLHTKLALPNMAVARQPIATVHLVVLNDKIATESATSAVAARGDSKQTATVAGAASAALHNEDPSTTVKETLNCKTKDNVKSLVCGACIQIIKGCAHKSELLNRVRHSWFQAAVHGTIKSAQRTKDGQLIVQSRYWPRLDKLPFEHEFKKDGKEYGYASVDTPNMPSEFGRKKQPLYQKWLEQQGCVAYSLPPRLQAAMTEERNTFLEARRVGGAGADSSSSSSSTIEQLDGRQEDHPNRVYADALPEDELVFPRGNKRKTKKGAGKAAKDVTAPGVAMSASGSDMDEESNGEDDKGTTSDVEDKEAEEEDASNQSDPLSSMPVIDTACWIEPDKLMERRSDIVQFMIAIDPRACAARNGTMTSVAYTPMDRSRAIGTTNFLLVNRQLDKIERAFEYDDFINWATKVLIRHTRPVFCFDMDAATKANADFVRHGHSLAKQLETLYDREEELAAKIKPQTDELKKKRKARTELQNSYSDFLVKAVESDVSLSFLTEHKLVVTRLGVAKKSIGAGTATQAKARAAAPPSSFDAKVVREVIRKSMSDKTRACFVADEILRSEGVDQIMQDIYKFHAQLTVARTLSRANDQPRFRVRRLKVGAKKGAKGKGGTKTTWAKPSSSATAVGGDAPTATPVAATGTSEDVVADAHTAATNVQDQETKQESSPPKNQGSKRKWQDPSEETPTDTIIAGAGAGVGASRAQTAVDAEAEVESTPPPRPTKRARIALSS
jgi:hypothetical protein